MAELILPSILLTAQTPVPKSSRKKTLRSFAIPYFSAEEEASSGTAASFLKGECEQGFPGYLDKEDSFQKSELQATKTPDSRLQGQPELYHHKICSCE